jgi:hypothetical protein
MRRIEDSLNIGFLFTAMRVRQNGGAGLSAQRRRDCGEDYDTNTLMSGKPISLRMK